MDQDRDHERPVAVAPFRYTGNRGQWVPFGIKCIQVLPCVTEIPNRAFDDFSFLQEIRFSVPNPDNSGGEDNPSHQLQRIGQWAFRNCELLSEIVLPDTVQVIGNEALEGCTHLRLVQLPQQELTQLGDGVFRRCKSLTSIRLPNSLIRMGASTFARCWRLEEVELSNALHEIPLGTFELCYMLKRITIPQSVKTIGNHAFSHCYALVQVHLVKGLRQVHSNAFCRCTGLLTIRIPSTVVTIGIGAFCDCFSLHTVEFADGNLQVLNGLAFEGCTTLFHLDLPASIHTSYPNTFSRCTFQDILSKSKNRFAPLFLVHKLCYLQVHKPLSATLEAIQSLKEECFDADRQVESVRRMTPFHILAASSRPDPLLFEVLMMKYPTHLWQVLDASNTTAMSYLLGNHSPESSAAIEYIMNSVLQDRIAFIELYEWRIRLQDMVDAATL